MRKPLGKSFDWFAFEGLTVSPARSNWHKHILVKWTPIIIIINGQFPVTEILTNDYTALRGIVGGK